MFPRKRIHAKIDELFSVRSVPRDYRKEKEGRLSQTESVTHLEAGSNTTNVALRVVGGDKKGTQCLGV
jgi:hypothetical protein